MSGLLIHLRKGLKHSNFLVWTGIRQAIPRELKRLEVNENEKALFMRENKFSF